MLYFFTKKGFLMLNVMIVDDSKIITRTLSKNFENMGFNIVGIAMNGQDAIEMYKKLKPDLVTMDITMPIMDGIEALKIIHEFDEKARIVMVTSHGEEKLVMDAITFGAKGYILKPITPLKVKQAIQKTFPKIADVIEENYLSTTLTY